MSNQDLTEDQLKFLKECEVEFANRFTEADRGMAEDDWNLTSNNLLRLQIISKLKVPAWALLPLSTLGTPNTETVAVELTAMEVFTEDATERETVTGTGPERTGGRTDREVATITEADISQYYTL